MNAQRVSKDRVARALQAFDSGQRPDWNGFLVVDVLRDLQDARAENAELRAEVEDYRQGKIAVDMTKLKRFKPSIKLTKG